MTLAKIETQIVTRGKRKPKKLPHYLEKPVIEEIIRHGEHGRAKAGMLLMWRAALRITEACGIEPRDLAIAETDHPTLKVREAIAKNKKARIVPVHPELGVAMNALITFKEKKTGPLIGASNTTLWRWVREAVARAKADASIPPGIICTPHTFRHSCARHWLASGVLITEIQHWLGHADIKTTMIYLQLFPDPRGQIEKVP